MTLKRPLSLLAVLLFFIIPLATSSTLAAAPGPDADNQDEYQRGFQCPDLQSGTYRGTVECPVYIMDDDPPDLLSQPILLIDPKDVSLMGFNSLHGGRGLHLLGDPPSDRSRDNDVHQPHTTFRTTDEGVRWEDMPYYAPDHLKRDGRKIFGEDNAAALDAQGLVYLASLYAYQDGQGGPLEALEGNYRYVVNLWSADRLNRGIDYFRNSVAIDSEHNGFNKIDSIHMVHVGETDRMMVFWREEARDNRGLGDDGGPASFIRVHYTEVVDRVSWRPADADRIGPCSAITNPLVHGTQIYIGCFPDDGYVHSASRTLQIHALDSATLTQRHVSSTPIQAGHTLLVEGEAPGRMILVASELTSGGEPRVLVSRGEEGQAWSAPTDLGPDLALDAPADRIEVRITAAAVSPRSHILQLVYMERYDSALGSGMNLAAYDKSLAAVGNNDRYLGSLDLGLGGRGLPSLDPYLTGMETGVFNDLKDSIVVWQHPDTGHPRVFVAYGDYGYFRFAELTEQDWPPLAVVGTAGVPAVPAAVSGLNPLTYGIVAGLLSSAMLARMLMARKKSTAEAPDL